MRVLFLIAYSKYNGGTEILAANLFKSLQTRGCQCLLMSKNVFITNDEYKIPFPETDFSKYNQIKAQPWDKLLGGRFSNRVLCKMIERVAVENNIDWIICHTYGTHAALPSSDRFKTVQIIHWSVEGFESSILKSINNKPFPLRLVSWISYQNYVKSWHKGFERVNKLVLLSNNAHGEIESINAKVKDSQLVTIPDPLMQTTDSTHVSSLKNKNIVYVGRLSQEKGVMRLLSIWERISKRLPDYTLSIYGEGHMKDEMLRYIADNELKCIEFKGFEKDLEKIYTNADLCLMTSDTEGFGMVLIEAMYYGVPCVSFDCPVSPKEIIGDAGVTVSCFDEDAYADAVVKLLQDPEQMRTLQQKSIERARDFYIDKVIDKWMALLSSKD